MKKELIKSIASNITVLAVSLILLVTMSFAWFISSTERKTQQTMQVGNFEVAFSEKDFEHIESPSLIAIEAAYPQTQASAVTEGENGIKPIYTFAVSNTGDIPAQIRLSVQVRSDSGYNSAAEGALPLSGQIRYLVKMYELGTPEPSDWIGGGSGNAADVTQGGLLFGTQENNLSFKQFMNTRLLTKNADNSYSAKDFGLVPINKTVVFKMLVWLNKDATVISTGADTTGSPTAKKPKIEFSVTLDALQSGGGATFTLAEVSDKPEETTPTPITKAVTK